MSPNTAALTIALDHPNVRLRVLPAGIFRARDGRPQELPGWRMDGAIAARMVAAAGARTDDFVIDFEHASMMPGRQAPAAGWFRCLEWQEGDGLFATDVRWTDRARAMIIAREYRYLSPVFRFDARSGEVQALVSVALTNSPALEGLVDLASLAAAKIEPGRAVRDLGGDRANEAFANLMAAADPQAAQAATSAGLETALAAARARLRLRFGPRERGNAQAARRVTCPRVPGEAPVRQGPRLRIGAKRDPRTFRPMSEKTAAMLKRVVEARRRPDSNRDHAVGSPPATFP